MRAGTGGRGAAHFRREAYVPRGGPDGGDGGRGGSIVIVADQRVHSLADIATRRSYRAEDGRPGEGGRRLGRAGRDLVLKVPVGTTARELEGDVIADLATDGQRAVLARGGAGGRGNVHFKSSVRRAPDYAEPGVRGEEKELELELRLIADVALVGPPNAGKSSLLAAMTRAKPKIAAYPFTTLSPELGVAETAAGRMVVADVPGLIEGASRGSGLGLEFLRHCERSRVFIYVADGASEDPFASLEAVRREIAAYSRDLAARPHVIAVNKVDLPEVSALKRKTRRRGVSWVSALTGAGVPELMDAAAALLPEAPPRSEQVVPARHVVLRPKRPARWFNIEKRSWGFEVVGDAALRVVERADLESSGGLARFQAAIDRLGVDEALVEAGVKPGDTVRVGEVEFEWSD